MANEVVKYDNSLNDVNFKSFSAKEFDLFFAICAKMKDKYTKEIELSFDQLRELSKYKSTSINRFMSDLDETYTKLLQLTYGEKNSERIRRFVLFTGFDINAETRSVKIKINEEFQFLLNDFKEYTKYELETFTSIKKTYAKSIYRKLKQFDKTGYYIVKIDDFRQLLDIPEWYRMSEIDRRVLKPTIEELAPLYKSLDYEKIFAKKGNKVERIAFYFSKFEEEDITALTYNWVDGTKLETIEEKYKREKDAQERNRK